MRKGRIAVIDRIDGRSAAALLVDGRLHDLLIDPPDDGQPHTGEIYAGKAQQPMKGQNGIVIDLGDGKRGFLKQAKGIAPGTTMLVQVATFAEGDKAPPVTQKILFKGRYAIVTPDAPGINVARSIKDEEERERLLEIAHECLTEAPEGLGLILRSACNGVAAEPIEDELIQLLGLADKIAKESISEPGLLFAAPSAEELAWRDWVDPDPDEVYTEPDGFETLGVWDHIQALRSPKVPLTNGASMIIEQTSALVAVDVNTGSDFSLTAGLKANLAAAGDLPRQLRLRGMGGQITIDFAPSPKKDRRVIEHALRNAFRSDSTETTLVGWTPLGHFELQRKRERIPLPELLPE